MGWSMAFIDDNQAKSTAMGFTTRYINILVRMDWQNLWEVLMPMVAPREKSAKERLSKIRQTMLKEFHKFIVCDRDNEYEQRCMALDSVIAHLECAVAMDASKVPNEVWSTPLVLIKEAELILEDIKTLK